MMYFHRNKKGVIFERDIEFSLIHHWSTDGESGEARQDTGGRQAERASEKKVICNWYRSHV